MQREKDKLRVKFIRNRDKFEDGSILVDYNNAELIYFTKEVENDDSYALAFGSIAADGKLVLSSPMEKHPEGQLIVFKGYSIA